MLRIEQPLDDGHGSLAQKLQPLYPVEQMSIPWGRVTTVCSQTQIGFRERGQQ